MNNLPSTLFSRRFDSLFNDTFPFSRHGIFGPDYGSVNVKDKGDHYEMTMSTPGLTDKEVKMEIKDGVLSIKAEKEAETKEEEKEYLLREFSHVSLDRSFILPREIESDKINAKMDKGVLHINLPKSKNAAAGAKKIEIKS